MKSRANTGGASNGKLCDANELPLQDAGTDKKNFLKNPADYQQSAGFLFGFLKKLFVHDYQRCQWLMMRVKFIRNRRRHFSKQMLNIEHGI